MTTRTVRVTRTWDREVEAEYGDDYASLCEKVTDADLDAADPDAENRVVLEEHESKFDKWYERPDAAITAAALAEREERREAADDPGTALVAEKRAEMED